MFLVFHCKMSMTSNRGTCAKYYPFIIILCLGFDPTDNDDH